MKILISVLGDCILRKPWHGRGKSPKMAETGLDFMKPAKKLVEKRCMPYSPGKQPRH